MTEILEGLIVGGGFFLTGVATTLGVLFFVALEWSLWSKKKPRGLKCMNCDHVYGVGEDDWYAMFHRCPSCFHLYGPRRASHQVFIDRRNEWKEQREDRAND